MLPFGVRGLMLAMLGGIVAVVAVAGWGLGSAAGQNDEGRKAAQAKEGPVAPPEKPNTASERAAPEEVTFPPAPPSSPEEREKLHLRIDALILELGDASLETRERATVELQAIGNLARSPLEKAAESLDREVSHRAKKILAGIRVPTHLIVDAVNGPIPRAKVIFRVTARSPGANNAPPEGPPRLVGAWSDEAGRIAIPEVDANEVSCVAQIEHPDYGVGRCQVDLRGELKQLRFPLVRQGSELRERALNGVLVAPDGRPVAGAVVECAHVRTPGEGLINAAYPRSEALTDEAGHFSYYLPNVNADRSRGDVIPVNSRYHVLITVPEDDAYFPLSAALSNGAPIRVEMPRPTERHRFRFQLAEDQWLETPEQLRNLHVTSKAAADRPAVQLDPQSLLRGRGIPAGTYLATLSDQHGKMVRFESLTVDRNSPEELIFRLPKPIVYQGRVVHALTHQAVPGAIVIGWNSAARNNLALLSDDDWKLLAETPSNPPADHPAMKLLGQFYGVQGVVRTDGEGRFELTRQADQDFYGLLAFNQTSVPFKVRVVELKPDGERRIDAGEFPLFAAAKVMIRPIFGGDRLPISPEWLPTDGAQPAWFGQFQAIRPLSDRDFEYVHWLTINESQPVYVPAGVRLRLRVNVPYNEEWTPALIDTPVELEPGASFDLGEVRFAASLPAEVLVVNEAGQPVEGFAVRRKYDGENHWGLGHNSDKNGKVSFHLIPKSKGQFRITDLKGPPEISKAKNLSVEFHVGETAPQEPFHIMVTDEQIAVLRGAR